MARDTEYGNYANGPAFDTSGRLVTLSFDGHVRLSDAVFRPQRKAPTPGGKRPYVAAFSPDGRYITVGYADTTQVDVLASTNLSQAYVADIIGVKNGDLSRVAWSRGGRSL